MLNNITIGRYYPIKSKIHNMNPVIKIICTIIYVLTTFICSDIKIMLALTFLVVLMIELSHLPKKIYFNTFKSLRFLILFTAVIYYLVGTDLNSVVLMIIRLVNIVLYTTMLTLTTPPTEITYGLQKSLGFLKILNIPVNRMSLSISLALRFIPTIIDQGNKILKSQASRGIDYYASSIKGKFTAIKSMLLPMFILTIRRADNLSEAMQIRLYDINYKRTNFRINSPRIFDISLLLMHFTIIGLIFYRMVIL